jgi:predicted nucleotidyltransferase
MDRKTNRIVRPFLASLRRKFEIRKVVLFGSRARGDNHDDSDVDLLIVSPDFSKLDFLSRSAEVLKYWRARCDLEALCYTPEEYERMRMRMGIVTVADREGIVLSG